MKDRKSCVLTIKLNYLQLSNSEKQIADYILKNTSAIPVMPLAKLSKLTGKSQPSVLRLVRKLGFDGYSDFKRQLLLDGSEPQPREEEGEYPTLTKGTSVDQLPHAIIGATCKALSDTLDIVDIDLYRKAIELIRNAQSIDLYGVGYSGNVASDFMTRLLRIGINCRAMLDNHLQQIGACSLKKGDLAIGISHSGATVSTINALRTAREAGAATIAITSYQASKINKYADITLLTGGLSSPLLEQTMTSRILQTTITDILYIGTLLSDYDGYIANYDRVQKILQENEQWRRRFL